MSSQSRSHTVSVVVRVIIGVALLLAAAFAWMHQRDIRDTLLVWQYAPSDEIASIAERATMTDEAKRYFYASRPELLAAEEFEASCGNDDHGTAVLGCYTQERIYLYAVDNAELDGVEEVTAAHEMLHAAWIRLSDEERTALEATLDSAYNSVKTDELEGRMAYYEERDGESRYNELHSILATEFSTIGNELEEYYAQYFDDRSAVVDLYEGYSGVISDLNAEATSLRAQLAALKSAIDAEIQEYELAVAQLNQDIEAHAASRNQVDRTSQADVDAYNAAGDELTQRSEALQVQRSEIAEATEQYNSLAEQYNAVAVHRNELVESLDSSSATEAPSVEASE